MYRSRNLGWFNLLALAGLLLGALALPIRVPVALAAGPSSVTIAGDLQNELGCPGDWQPDCAATHLAATPADPGVFTGSFTVPSGRGSRLAEIAWMPVLNTWPCGSTKPGTSVLPPRSTSLSTLGKWLADSGTSASTANTSAA